MTDNGMAKSWLLGMAGAVVGGAIGYYVFMFLAERGYLALLLPGAAIGIGCGYMSKTRSVPLGIVCGVLALGFGLFAEWMRAPFATDASFGFFISHPFDLPSVTQIFILLGGVCGFWFGMGRERFGRS